MTSSTVLGKRDKTTNSGDDLQADRPPTKWFRCGDCDKSYTRVDHLARHVRQHTQERPYVCDICNKGFGRADLLKRHASVHADTDGHGSAQQSSRQGRVSQACVTCAELHLKCDNTKPCQRCKSRKLFCQYQARQADDEAVAQDLLSLAQRPVNVRQLTPINPNTSQDLNIDFTQHTDAPRGPLLFDETTAPPVMNSTEPNSALGIPSYPDVSVAFDGNDLRDFLQGIMTESADVVAPSQPLGVWTSRSLFELGLDTDLELNDLDREFLASYSLNNPFGVTSDAIGPPNFTPSASEPPIKGADSIQKASTWRYRPASCDYNRDSLTLPAQHQTRRLMASQRITKSSLSYITRDLLIALLIAARGRHASNSAVSSSLPALELLDSLLQFYLAHVPAPCQIVHIPTFDPLQARPELTMMLIAAGAVSVPDQHLRKLGLALQEAARIAIGTALETDNTMIRNAELHTGAVLGLEIGTWSGNSRKMEQVEAFIKIWVTCIRGGGGFRRRHHHDMPRHEDTGASLEAKWQTWIKEETEKRLIFYIFKIDAQLSMATFTSPVISYADLHLALPFASELWNAPSAEAWKALYLSKYQFLGLQPPSMLDVLRKVDQFGNNPSASDEQVAIHALLSASWGLVREYRQSSALLQGTQNCWSNSSLRLSSQLDEIRQLLECLRLSCLLPADLSLSIEIQSMHLHISLEDVHILAGVEGQEEARRAYPALVEWARTPAARQAIWHAGQTVRHAEQIPSIQQANAVAVYQAGLALWSYGVVTNANPPQRLSPEGVQQNEDGFVALDGLHSTKTQKFLALGRGTPGFAVTGTSGREHVLLSNPRGIMLRLVRLLRASHQPSSSIPPLVENLVELLGSLGAAAASEGTP